MIPVVLHLRAGTRTGGGVFAAGLATALRKLGVPVVLPYRPGDELQQDFADFPTATRTDAAIHVEQVGSECHAPNRYDPPGEVVAICCMEGPLERPGNLGRYARLIALSEHSAALMREAGYAVTVCNQGYDPAVFHPAPRRQTFPGDPRIFSGGALQSRKAQDVVCRQFAALCKTDPDAYLVCVWHSPHPGLALDLPNPPVQMTERGPVLTDIPTWIEGFGVPRYRFEVLPSLAPHDLADVMRSCDEAWFPNRLEGATNQMLIEAKACGCRIVADWTTGQADAKDANLMDWTWDAVAPQWKAAIYG